VLRFGTVPILWNNDDLRDLRGGFVIPPGEVLDAIQKTGFSGTELGRNYPRDAATLRQELKSRGLTLSGAYYCPGLTDAARAEAALDDVEPFLEFLEATGCEFLVAAEPLESRRAAVAGRAGTPREAGGGNAMPEVPALESAGWSSLAQALNELGWRCKGRGIRLVFHNHAGTWVETPPEVARLLEATDPDRVGLCLDTGHWTVGGGDAAAAVRQHLPRLKYLHLKDVDPAVLAALRSEGFGFLEALRRRVFTELGTGCVDVAGIAEALRDAAWSGWIVSEQDTSYLEPCDSAAQSFAALSAAFGEVAVA
jgi:inosose dehydratase